MSWKSFWSKAKDKRFGFTLLTVRFWTRKGKTEIHSVESPLVQGIKKINEKIQRDRKDLMAVRCSRCKTSWPDYKSYYAHNCIADK